MRAPAESIPAYIYRGRILDVDAAQWTMTVRTEVANKTFYKVPIASPYLHLSDGEGIHIMPEPGAYVLVCAPSDPESRAMVIAYAPVVDERGSSQSNRPLMIGGDISLTTRDRNGMVLRRGGVVEVFATPISRMMFLPKKNEIVSFCENWRVEAFGGSMQWTTFRPEEHPTGLKGTQLSFDVKRFADDLSGVVRTQYGDQIDDDHGSVVKTTVYETGGVRADERAMVFDVGINQSGYALIHSLGVNVSLLEEGSYVSVFNDEANIEGVVLGKTFLTDLQRTLTGIQTVLTSLGFPVDGLPEILANLAAALVTPQGTAPYISTRLKTE